MRSVQAPPGTQALQRAMGLLKQFRSEHPNQTLAELSAALGLTKSTTHRLLAAMESEGLIARDESGNTYHLGASLIALGNTALQTSDVRSAARPILEQLARDSRETTTLEVQVGNQMLVLDGVPGQHLISARLELTSSWPIHATSTGKCVMAATVAPDRRLLRASLTQLTPNTITEPDAIRRELREIRDRGYAVARAELVPDYVAVGAAFRDPDGDVEGALSVGGPESRFTPQRVQYLGERVMAAAAELTAVRARGRSK